jgi:transcriptional regulator with XRE-family HTH domain
MKIRRKNTDPIDVHIGTKLRQARVLAGLSQGQLGKLFGVTFQQVQKYESGANRISAGGLVVLANILKMPITYFYEGLPRKTPNNVLPSADDFLLRQRETLEFVRVYHRIETSERREKLLSFLKFAVERPD